MSRNNLLKEVKQNQDGSPYPQEAVGPDISIPSISFPALYISHQRSTSVILSRSLVDTLYVSR
jgi:hypothetical protein